MQIKKIASFDVKNGASTVRYADLDDGISFFPTDGIINIKSNKVRIAGFGVDANSLYRIDSSGAMYPLGNSNSVFLSNEGLLSSASIGGSSGNNKWILAISDDFGVTDDGTLYAKNAEITGTISGSTINGGTINGATITGTVTNGGTITGGNIWGNFVQAQFLQTASNSATNGHGCDLWTAVIKCSSIIDQTTTSRIDLSDEKVHIYTYYNSNILLSPSYARIQASNGPYVCCDGNGVSLYGNANNLQVCADNKIWVKEYDGGTMNTGTVVFSRNGGHTVSFYWGNDTGGWHLQTYVDNQYVGNAV